LSYLKLKKIYKNHTKQTMATKLIFVSEPEDAGKIEIGRMKEFTGGDRILPDRPGPRFESLAYDLEFLCRYAKEQKTKST
jgi:hypothetical protein